jgi:hypothetical protein
MCVVPLDEAQGHLALGLALRHLSNTGLEGCDVVTSRSKPAKRTE